MQLIREKPRAHPLPSLVLAAVLAVLGFVVALAVLRRALPPPHDNLQYRITSFAQHKDEYDLVFVGSSHVKAHVSPALFDTVLSERGCALRSCNLGVMGLDAIPLAHVVHRIASLAPARLAWVLIDPESVVLNVPAANATSTRVILWHDTPTTWLTMRALCASDLEPGRAIDCFAQGHSRAWAMNLTNLGLGRDSIERALSPSGGGWTDEEVFQLQGPDGDGFLPYEIVDGVENQASQIARAGATYLHSEKYERIVQALERTVVPDGPIDEPTALVLGEIESAVRSIGATPVFVLGPQFGAQENVVRMHRTGRIQHLLAFNHPELYPELYAVENRLEHSHLNAQGAKIYTRLLAEAFAELVTCAARER